VIKIMWETGIWLTYRARAPQPLSGVR